MYAKELAEVLDLFRGEGLRADTDPGKVQPPGLWIEQIGITWDRLSGATLNLAVWVAVKDGPRTAEALDQLLAKTIPVMRYLTGPSGAAVWQLLQLPNHPAPTPAMRIPLDVLTDQ